MDEWTVFFLTISLVKVISSLALSLGVIDLWTVKSPGMSNPAWDSLRKVEVFTAAASVAPPSLRRAVEMALKEDNYETMKKGPRYSNLGL